MKAIELVGDINEQHRLRAQVPNDLPAGPVRLIVLQPEEDEAGMGWAQGVAKEWADDLDDTRQYIIRSRMGKPLMSPGEIYLGQFPFSHAVDPDQPRAPGVKTVDNLRAALQKRRSRASEISLGACGRYRP